MAGLEGGSVPYTGPGPGDGTYRTPIEKADFEDVTLEGHAKLIRGIFDYLGEDLLSGAERDLFFEHTFKEYSQFEDKKVKESLGILTDKLLTVEYQRQLSRGAIDRLRNLQRFINKTEEGQPLPIRLHYSRYDELKKELSNIHVFFQEIIQDNFRFPNTTEEEFANLFNLIEFIPYNKMKDEACDKIFAFFFKKESPLNIDVEKLGRLITDPRIRSNFFSMYALIESPFRHEIPFNERIRRANLIEDNQIKGNTLKSIAISSLKSYKIERTFNEFTDFNRWKYEEFLEIANQIEFQEILDDALLQAFEYFSDRDLNIAQEIIQRVKDPAIKQQLQLNHLSSILRGDFTPETIERAVNFISTMEFSKAKTEALTKLIGLMKDFSLGYRSRASSMIVNNQLIQMVIEIKDKQLQQNLFDSLIFTASHANQPYTAIKLYSYIESPDQKSNALYFMFRGLVWSDPKDDNAFTQMLSFVNLDDPKTEYLIGYFADYFLPERKSFGKPHPDDIGNIEIYEAAVRKANELIRDQRMRDVVLNQIKKEADQRGYTLKKLG